jgi:hypothetical protein
VVDDFLVQRVARRARSEEELPVDGIAEAAPEQRAAHDVAAPRREPLHKVFEARRWRFGLHATRAACVSTSAINGAWRRKIPLGVIVGQESGCHGVLE